MAEEYFDFERYRHYLMSFARSISGGDAAIDAEDAVQHTISCACEKHACFRGHTEAQCAAWLRSILWNFVRDASRRATRRIDEQELGNQFNESTLRPANLFAASDPAPSYQVQQDEDFAKLRDQIATLAEDQREAVELRYLHECSLGEITDRMQRSRASVAGLLQRGLRKLRHALASHER